MVNKELQANQNFISQSLNLVIDKNASVNQRKTKYLEELNLCRGKTQKIKHPKMDSKLALEPLTLSYDRFHFVFSIRNSIFELPFFHVFQQARFADSNFSLENSQRSFGKKL